MLRSGRTTTTMDDLKDILERRVSAKPNKNIHSPAHALADEITTAFGERKRFAMYLGVIKRVGVEQARRIYRQMAQDQNARDRGRLFMYLCRKEPKAPPEAAGPQAEPKK